MRVTVLANGKGGCGKTTLATTLASALAAAGKRVALADADPQRSSTTWLTRRPADAAPVGAIDWSFAAPRTIQKSLALAERSLDWLIVDAPADLSHNMRVRRRLGPVLARADSVIAPATPSIFDEHATRRFLADIETSAPELDAAEILLVANRVKKKRTTKHAGADQALPSVAMLRERQAYAKLAASGLSLFDSSGERHQRVRREWTPLLEALCVEQGAAW